MQTQADRLDQAIDLTDGRILGYAEYGPAAGPVLFLFHGLPGSRLAAPEMWPQDPPAVRVIAPDRPGMGRSAFQLGRRLTDWADDIRQLADALRIRQFHVAGYSGGGPHALAVAHGLPDRVIAAGSIAGAGPIDTREARQSLRHAHAANRLIFAIARTAPGLLWPLFARHARTMRRHPATVVDADARAKGLPQADRQAMTDPRLRDQIISTASEAFRQGPRGIVHEARILAKPWGFDPADIKIPVRLWHGDEDANAPAEMARHLAERIPSSDLRLYKGEGHMIVPRHWDEILTGLLSIDPRPA